MTTAMPTKQAYRSIGLRYSESGYRWVNPSVVTLPDGTDFSDTHVIQLHDPQALPGTPYREVVLLEGEDGTLYQETTTFKPPVKLLAGTRYPTIREATSVVVELVNGLK